MTQLGLSLDLPAYNQADDFAQRIESYVSNRDALEASLSELEVKDVASLIVAATTLQQLFHLYQIIKLEEANLDVAAVEQFTPAIKQVIGGIFTAMAREISRVHESLATSPQIVGDVLAGNVESDSEQRLAMWNATVTCANLAARTSALNPQIETDFWTLSDTCLVQLHERFGFTPGLSFSTNANVSAVAMPLVLDWTAMADGQAYLRPYFTAVSHRDFPQDRVNDTHAVDLMVNGGHVIAVASGRVIASRFDADAGGMDKNLAGKDNYIFVQADDGLIYAYRHLAKLADNHPLRHALSIQNGQDLDAVSMTGLTSELHLHFAVYQRTESGVLESLPLQLTQIG